MDIEIICTEADIRSRDLHTAPQPIPIANP